PLAPATAPDAPFILRGPMKGPGGEKNASHRYPTTRPPLASTERQATPASASSGQVFTAKKGRQGDWVSRSSPQQARTPGCRSQTPAASLRFPQRIVLNPYGSVLLLHDQHGWLVASAASLKIRCPRVGRKGSTYPGTFWFGRWLGGAPPPAPAP